VILNVKDCVGLSLIGFGSKVVVQGVVRATSCEVSGLRSRLHLCSYFGSWCTEKTFAIELERLEGLK